MKRMKQIILSLVVALIFLAAVPTEKAEAAAKLSQTKTTIYVGNKATLKVKGTTKKVTWSTSKASVATVKKGVVTAKKKGTATITAKVSGKKYTCKVTVKNQELSKKTATMRVEDTLKLKVNGAYKKVTWSTSDKKVATVSSTGKVTAVGKGTVKIIAVHNGKKLTCTITVKAKSKNIVIKVDKEFVNDEDMKPITKPYLKKLDIKSKETKGKYVYYTVTRTSYEALMSSIKETLDEDIANLVKCQNEIKKIKYNSKCTKLKMYINTSEEAMDEELTEEIFDYIMSMSMDIVFYQAFDGVLLDDMSVTYDCYDYATGEFLYSM